MQLQGVHVLAHGEPLPDFDYHCPLLSLPHAFDTRLETIPLMTRYLCADPIRIAAWHGRLQQSKKPRVGVVWSGSASHRNDRKRSIPLSQMAELLSSDVQFVSLQKDLRRGDENILRANAN